MLRRKKVRWGAAWFVLVMTACVSGSIRQVTLTSELPSDLPKELKERFAIQENLNLADIAPGSDRSGGSRHLSSLASSSRSGKTVKRKKRSKRNRATDASGGGIGPVFIYPDRRPGRPGNPGPERDPIRVGERFVYSISYLGVPAGDFTLQVLPFKRLGSRSVYHIRGNAITSAIFSLFYRLNDYVESFIDYEGHFSHRFHILLNETKQTRDALELNDSEKKQTFYWNRWSHLVNGKIEKQESKEYGAVEAFSQDSLSALYYLRTVPLPTGAVVTFPVISEGKTWDAVCTVVGREERDTPLGRVQTIVIRPETKYQGILKKSGNSSLWLTDDDRRVPVRLEAKVRVGSVVADLRVAELGQPFSLNPPTPSAEPSTLSSFQPVPSPEPSSNISK